MHTEKSKPIFYTGLNKNIFVIFYVTILTLSVFIQVIDFEFIDYDDHLYVSRNERVIGGLSIENLFWAFKATTAANWHPVTMISHMIDSTIFGMDAGMHHFISLLYHIANILVLFYVFKKITGDLWQSMFMSALFAIHPLHVEASVQIAQRKDLISTFFMLLTIACYFFYVAKRKLSYYLLMTVFFIIGLMAKPMIVTLPFLILLFDYWPLARVVGAGQKWGENRTIGRYAGIHPLIIEKLPLFLISFTFCSLTYIVQKQAGAVQSLRKYTFDERFGNALISYVKYILKTVWPVDLSFYYPYPETQPVWQIAGAAILLIALTVFAYRLRKKAPYFIVGWLWFLGSLVPVIGIVQVGSQSMADRYTYVPLIGLFVIISWGLHDLVKLRFFEQSKKILLSISMVILTALTGKAWCQTSYWENSVKLFRQAIYVNAENAVAHHNLGIVLSEHGKIREAIHHYRAVIRINPKHKKVHNNLGLAFMEQGKVEKAIRSFQVALDLDPDYIEPHNNIALAYFEKGEHSKAVEHIQKSLEIDASQAGVHNNLAVFLAKWGRFEESITHFKAALQYDPDSLVANENLKEMFSSDGLIQRAISKMENETEYDNKDDTALSYMKLGDLYKMLGKTDDSIRYYRMALSLLPNLNEAMEKLAVSYAMKGRYNRSVHLLEALIEKSPENVEAPFLIASIYARQNEPQKSVVWLKRAVKKGYGDLRRLRADPNFDNIRSSDEFRRLLNDISKDNFTSEFKRQAKPR